jgi:adenosyl cobinamide kinase/adenosyl cobinamide phosphate guanylyltransferase
MAMMLLLGGARSGKSSLAVKLMSKQANDVAMIVTAQGGDAEMRERILNHQSNRPRHWQVVEEPIEIVTAMTGIRAGDSLIVDCLTLWVSNLMGLGLEDAEVEARAVRAAAVASSRDGRTIVVSNEVGTGIVPDNALARRYRDLLGRVNAIWADASEEVYMTVAGGVLHVQGVDSVWADQSRD